ncbi:acyltransferase [Microbacteriaceae bacterium K1510]|nr:acyltransferase [Microbacteriaceae bacterium K1510]
MPPLAVQSVPSSEAPQGTDRRIVALDGVRGLMTILVVVSHYFAEVPSGITALMLGRLAVEMFFVLSGFLVGTLILDKLHNDNFFLVFYVRRVCRTLPIYFVSVLLVAAILSVCHAAWAQDPATFPVWSYLTFTQTFFMANTETLGAHWLAPTWTLAVEEHFYLLAPLTFFLVPRRHLAKVLVAVALGAVLCRAAVQFLNIGNPIAVNVLLPGIADILVAGLLAALAAKTNAVREGRFDYALRVAPVGLLLTVAYLGIFAGRTSPGFVIFSPLLSATACALFLLAIVRNAPEAARFHSPVLRFFGRTSYAVYLTHLPVLGLMHGLILNDKPDIGSVSQSLVTIAALPLCVLVGWLLTKCVEEPITRYGRTWLWSNRPRTARDAIVTETT